MRGDNTITKKMEAWWAEHGGRHDHPEWISYVNEYGSLLIDKLVEMSEEHTNNGRFGMSKAGGCTRSVALKHRGYEGEPLSGSTRATFAIGHVLEAKVLATLRACGYEVGSFQSRVRIDPWGESACDGIISLDGVLHDLSVKSVGYKMSGKRYGKGGVTWTRHGFAAIVANGVKAEQPGHWAQIQAEMHGSHLRHGLIVYVAKDMVKAMEEDPEMIENGSLTFYAERVEYDAEFCKSLNEEWGRAWNTAVQLGQSDSARYFTASGQWITLNPLDAAANKAATGTYDPCSYCDIRAVCIHPETFTLEVA